MPWVGKPTFKEQIKRLEKIKGITEELYEVAQKDAVEKMKNLTAALEARGKSKELKDARDERRQQMLEAKKNRMKPRKARIVSTTTREVVE